MASTVLPNGIIVPEKFSRDWYADLYHNWQELDNLLGGGTPKDGTLTIQKNGSTVGTFSANQATDETINITVPDVNDATLTIQQNSVTVDAFTANSSSDKTVNIQCVDLTSDQTVGGDKEFTGTTTAHDLVPSATDTYKLGTSTSKWKSFNDINPGALSLPGTLINVASNITVLDGTTPNKFTPQINGWLLINGIGLANNGFVYIEQGHIGMMSACNATMTRCEALIPIVAGVEVSVTCKLSTLIWANIATCRGNV